MSNLDINHITHAKLKQWAKRLGFQAIGVSNIDLATQEKQLKDWLAKNFQGDMEWMARHGNKRSRPNELETGTISIISVRMDYLPPQTHDPVMVLNHPELGYISRYALGRDYHKLMRKRLEKLAQQLRGSITNYEDMNYRVFVDSAPVMEKPIAVKAGLGWVGKHSNVLSQDTGSWFFLGEIYTNLPLITSSTVDNHCGDCAACIDICPTKAIVKPYVVDARRCISYLTIEHKGAIPVEFRKAIGNRIYGCDDCQIVCPWNRFASTSKEIDFNTRNNLDCERLVNLFVWNQDKFLKVFEGSPIRRIGYQRWQRNIAVALGNAPATKETIAALEEKYLQSTELVKEHIDWSLNQLVTKNSPSDQILNNSTGM